MLNSACITDPCTQATESAIGSALGMVGRGVDVRVGVADVLEIGTLLAADVPTAEIGALVAADVPTGDSVPGCTVAVAPSVVACAVVELIEG